MSIWWILFPVVLVSAGLTGVLRFYAISKKVMDIPNARSSHTVPTPRGGGVAIVLTFLLVVFFFPYFPFWSGARRYFFCWEEAASLCLVSLTTMVTWLHVGACLGTSWLHWFHSSF